MSSPSVPSAGRAPGPERFAVGIDIGTSTIKATVLSSTGSTATFTSRPHVTSFPVPGWSEQDPDDWWRGVGEVLDRVLDAYPGVSPETTVIGLVGQMHTTVLRDEQGGLVRPAILWSDTRAGREADELDAADEDWTSLTGHRPLPAFTSAHLAWMRAHEPLGFARVASVAVPKDDVRRRLGAGWATEPSDASAMNLMDTSTDQWSETLLAQVGLRREQLAPIVPSGAVTGEVRQLPPMRSSGERLLGVPVIAGAGDQAAQAIALGVLEDGALGLSVGTSGVAFRASSRARAGAFRHAVPGTWLVLESTHAAGLALAWWTTLSGGSFQDYTVTDDAGDDDRSLPMFLPFLQGGRREAGAPGTLTDLRATHGTREISAAVVEGVAIELIRLAHRVSDGGLPDQVVGVGGRAAQTVALQRLLAAGLGRPVCCSARGSAYGAAVLAGTSAGWLEDAKALDDAAQPVPPEPALTARLSRRLVRYTDLLEQLTAAPLPGDAADGAA